MARYGMRIAVPGTFDDVKSRVIAALNEQGFGILTGIDVQETMREKIGAEFEPYQILGACNPQLAHRALSVDRSIGLLLPCNVVLRAVAGEVEVSILDPEVMFDVADSETKAALAELPAQAKARLNAALEAVERG